MAKQEQGSVTEWIDNLRDGDTSAAEKIWKRYGPSLLSVAKKRLRTTRSRVSDEEDVALTAFTHFCMGVEEGRFAKLENRDDLWYLLVLLAQRRSIDQVRREARRRERGESFFHRDQGSDSSSPGIDRVEADDLLPDLAAEAVEQCTTLLDSLEDETLRQIANWKLEGFTNDEIASKLGVTTRTVERKLKLIRRKWSEEVA